MSTELHRQIVAVIKRIPRGKVVTYGQVAMLAGNPMAARQVVRALHSSSDKEKLPWHRVINSKGRIALKPGSGFEHQIVLLRREGIKVDDKGSVDLDRYQWSPRL